ncbi:MAG: GntR family transcriptional regulator [Solirubrobacteraceae bacterium]
MVSDLAALVEEGRGRGHRTLAEKAFEALHGAIITGQLRPGTRLPIEELAEVLEMSPMPVREAVRRLDAAGLVENIPHRGARVTELSIRDLAEVYEARLALELLAIRRAAVRFGERDESTARRRLVDLQRRPDDNSAATSVAHAEFHFALYEAADSAWLLRLIRPLWETAERYCLAVPECRQLAGRRREHEEILDACVAHDPDRAGLALRDHLARTADNIAVAMGSEPLPALATAAPSAAQVSPLQVLALEEL